ncbi:NAD+ synthase [candidate division KSB1 bacterium 4484_87]|nr:MAG: NAD+ synthase [candidate division KSB1 bacterium 4484_87]
MNSNSTLRIALAQINVTVGDLAGNVEKIKQYIHQAKEKQADIVAFPELTIPGYPPEDLLLRPQFIADNRTAMEHITAACEGIICIIGFADQRKAGLFNGAAVIQNREIKGIYHKIHLPNYGVFDEKRYFKEGENPLIFSVDGIPVGLSVCEDLWIQDSVIDAQALQGDCLININISASPFCSGKIEEREALVIDRARKNRTFLCYVNLIGGQDELVFDGSSLVVNDSGEIVSRCKQFAEDITFVDIDIEPIRQNRERDKIFQQRRESFPQKFEFDKIDLKKSQQSSLKIPIEHKQRRSLSQIEEIYHALVLGTRDYVHKNGFKKVVLGLSGGIDSALTAAIAADALGAENVIGVAMPSKFSSDSSLDDAQQLAQNLGIDYKIIPIQDTFNQYREMLKPHFLDLPFDVTEENIQARIRGNIIMALSNKFGWLALTTGNKSELSVGYCTLYGDMVGGFAVIKDVPKMMVYQLSEYLNKTREHEIIPRNTITKPPSAELRPEQKDSDSLPPYEILDPILQAYVEQNLSSADIISKGFDERIVRRVVHLVDRAEYKRRQAPPGIKITPRAFGKDRRMPITNHYHNSSDQ